MASFSDDFNRADSGNPGGNWNVDNGVWPIVSNTLRQTGVSNYRKLRWIGSSLDGNDNYAQVDGTANTVSVGYGAFVRGATNTDVTYYAAVIFPDDADYLVEITAGSETILDTGSARATGTLTVRTEATGTAVSGLVGGSASTSATDSSLTSGAAGVMCFGLIDATVAGLIDNFSAGDLGGVTRRPPFVQVSQAVTRAGGW